MLRRPLSLKARLLLGALLWIPLTLAITGYSIVSQFSEHAERAFEDDLGTSLRQLLALLDGRSGKAIMSGAMNEARFNNAQSTYYWQIEQNNTVLFHSPSLGNHALALPDNIAPDGEIHRFPITGPHGRRLEILECKVSLGTQAFTVVKVAVAADHEVVEQSIHKFTYQVLALFSTLGGILLLAVVLQIWGGLQPLQLLHKKLMDMHTGRAQRIKGRFPMEIQTMVDELNLLLDRNSELIARARMQAANLAHGLKTPLAVLATFGKKTWGEEISKDGEIFQKQINALQRQIDYTLARTRAASSVNVIGTHCEVSKRLEEIIHALKLLYQEKNIQIVSEIKPGLHIKMEAQDFDEILGNLLDNACKWAKDTIAVSSEMTAGKLYLFIDDDGPGLSQSMREKVFERGKRLDETIPGFGFGLSIVRELMESYHCRILLEDSPLRGLRVCLELPQMQGE